MKRFLSLSGVVLALLIALAVYWWFLKEEELPPEPLFHLLMGSDTPIDETGAILRFELMGPAGWGEEQVRENEALIGYELEPPKAIPSTLCNSYENRWPPDFRPQPGTGYLVVAGRLGGQFTAIDEFKILGGHREADALILDVKFRQIINLDHPYPPVFAYFSLCLPQGEGAIRTIEIRFKQVHSYDGVPEEEENLVPPVLKDVRLPGALGATPLSVVEARAALISLVDTLPRKRRLPRDSLDLLCTAAPKWLDESTVALGPWRCDLSKATFTATVSRGSRKQHYEGRFEQGVSDEWSAVLRAPRAD